MFQHLQGNHSLLLLYFFCFCCVLIFDVYTKFSFALQGQNKKQCGICAFHVSSQFSFAIQSKIIDKHFIGVGRALRATDVNHQLLSDAGGKGKTFHL